MSTLCLLFFINTVESQPGCTDPLATNYNSSATVNDGSCIYAASTVSPISSFNLPGALPESSGLIVWNNYVWTHNDNTDINLYALDTADGSINQSYTLINTINIDWEEISQDSNYVYVGDFGNNANGNRTDLKILRVEKNSVQSGTPLIDTISFSYSDQVDFTPTGSNNTDFDCEAFIVSTDSIYLFTKQWVNNKTRVYSVPKIPGNYAAALRDSFDIQGLVTGATFLEQERIVALCGYNILLQPFVFLLYDFSGSDFFSGNKRKIGINLPFYQIEGVATADGLKFYMANEYFSQLSVTTVQKFHIFDLSSFLGTYLTGIPSAVGKSSFLFYPNPATDVIIVEIANPGANYYLHNTLGQTVKSGRLMQGNSEINIAELPGGIYFLRIEKGISVLKVIKNNY